jgi:hypothetical protein
MFTWLKRLKKRNERVSISMPAPRPVPIPHVNHEFERSVAETNREVDDFVFGAALGMAAAAISDSPAVAVDDTPSWSGDGGEFSGGGASSSWDDSSSSSDSGSASDY